MFRSKERVIIFGAGIGGKRALRCLRHRCKILAFVDNDSRKHGKRLLGRPIVSPMALESVDFNKVYIASMYSPQICSQLLNDLRIDPSKIESVRQDILAGEYEVSGWSIATLILLGMLALMLALGLVLLAWEWVSRAFQG